MRKKKRSEAIAKRGTSRKRKVHARDIATLTVVMGGVVAGLLLTPMLERHEHDGDGAQEVHRAHHGGVTTFVGATEYELRMRREVLTLYIFERERPAVMENATVGMTLTGATRRLTLTLQQSGSNEFDARGDFAVDAYDSALVTITAAGSTRQVKFALR